MVLKLLQEDIVNPRFVTVAARHAHIAINLLEFDPDGGEELLRSVGGHVKLLKSFVQLLILHLVVPHEDPGIAVYEGRPLVQSLVAHQTRDQVNPIIPMAGQQVERLRMVVKVHIHNILVWKGQDILHSVPYIHHSFYPTTWHISHSV